MGNRTIDLFTRYRRRIATVMAMASITLAGVASPAFAQSAPTADEIFAKAIETWRVRPIPTYLTYGVTVTVERHARTHTDRQRVFFRTIDRIGVVRTPAGRVTFGRPRYVPDVAFRLVPRNARAFDDSLADAAEPEPSGPPLLTIGHATVSAKRYAVGLVGTERLHDHDVYHLLVKPLFDPARNSVREMWIDTNSFATWQLVDEAHYSVGPAGGTFFLTATYAPVRDAWLLRSVTTSGSLRFGLFAYGGKAMVTFDDLEIVDDPSATPCLERAGYFSHRRQCDAMLSF